VTVPDDMADSAAAVTRSTIGYLTEVLQGLEEGAVAEGMPREIARPFVTQTLLTTARLLQERPGSPADLKDQVASPGGTTITGLAVLEERAVRGALISSMRDAVEAKAAMGRPAPHEGSEK
jgi:pyrroline-5-carboxylate reductase